MTAAKITFDLYKKLGIFDGMYSISTLFCHERKLWVMTGNYHSENGYKSGKIAQFETVDDAVEFKSLCGY